MTRKLRNPKVRIDTEMTKLEREWFLHERWGCFIDPAPERREELWDEYHSELLAQYRANNPDLTPDEVREWFDSHQGASGEEKGEENATN